MKSRYGICIFISLFVSFTHAGEPELIDRRISSERLPEREGSTVPQGARIEEYQDGVERQRPLTGDDGSRMDEQRSTRSTSGGLNVDGDQLIDKTDAVSNIKMQVGILTHIANRSFFRNFDVSIIDTTKLETNYSNFSELLHPDKFNAEEAQSPKMRMVLKNFGVFVPEGKVVAKEDVEKAFKNMQTQYDILSNPTTFKRYAILSDLSSYKSVVSKIQEIQQKVDQLSSSADSSQIEDLSKTIELITDAIMTDPFRVQSDSAVFEKAFNQVEELSKSGFSAYRSKRSNRVDVETAQAEFENQRQHIQDRLRDINNAIEAYGDKDSSSKTHLLRVRDLYKKAKNDLERLESRLQLNPDSVSIENVQDLITNLQSTSAQINGDVLYHGFRDFERSDFRKIIDFFRDFINYHLRGGSSLSSSIAEKNSSDVTTSSFEG